MLKPSAKRKVVNHPTFSRLVVLITIFISLWLGASSVVAQEKNPQRGFPVGNGYALSDIETINTINGNLMFSLPLGTLAPGRAGLSGGIALRYNSKLYDSTVELLSDESDEPAFQNIIVATEQADRGGWHYSSPLDFTLKVVNRNDIEGGPIVCNSNGGLNNSRAVYIWKLKVVYPDGGEHDFRPTGYTDLLNDGYFDVDPLTGGIMSCSGVAAHAPNPLTYFSIDGTYSRLTMTRGAGGTVNWALSFPDGSRFEGGSSQGALYDRNNNFLTRGNVTLPNGHVVSAVVDQFSRYLAMESNAATREDYIYSLGYNDQVLMWTVKWKTIFVLKSYHTTGASSGIGRGGSSIQVWEWPVDVVDRVTMPAQLGDLFYEFSYNAPDYVIGNPEPTTNSVGWGEVNRVTLPSGASASYDFGLDGVSLVAALNTRRILENSVKKKTLNYLAEYDGSASTATEIWEYNITHTSSTITAPDGGQTKYYFHDTTLPSPLAGFVFRESHPNGEVVEREWQPNTPLGVSASVGANYYLKTEFRSVPNAARTTLMLTAITDYEYDKNGNVTNAAGYDWLPYLTAHPGGGAPTISGTPRSINVTNFEHYTPNAADTTTNVQTPTGIPAPRRLETNQPTPT